MVKCSPEVMRKNLTIVSAFKEAGIDFVVIPVSSKYDKARLLGLLNRAIEALDDDNA